MLTAVSMMGAKKAPKAPKGPVAFNRIECDLGRVDAGTIYKPLVKETLDPMQESKAEPIISTEEMPVIHSTYVAC